MDKKIGIIILSLIGVLFAGFLTVPKLLWDTCILNESCPYFLGQPACIFGLLFYTLILISAIILYKGKETEISPLVIKVVSGIGVLFSGYFTVTEFLNPAVNFFGNSLIVPTCVYGLAMYIIIFILALKLKE